MIRKTRGTMIGATAGAMAVAAAALLVPAPASAQASDVAAWLPFLGCWTDVEAPADAPLTCVAPADGGAEVLTVTTDGIVERQLLQADGVERAFASGGCEGVQAAEVSADGRRIFTRSTLACDGGIERSTQGITTMVAPDEWVDIRALTVGGGSVSWVKRYRAATSRRLGAMDLPAADRAELERVTERQGMAIETARLAAVTAPTVESIIEAHQRTDAEAVRAWIVEQGAPIELSADALLRLADAGVSREIIDVAVAVSYPARFAVAREAERGPDATDRWDRRGYEWDRYRYGSWYYDPFYYDPFYGDRYLYDRLHSGYGVGYSSGYGAYGRGWYGGPGVIVVRTAQEDAARSGRFVKGEGYRPASPNAGADAPRAVPSRPSSGSAGSSGAVRAGGSSSSGSKGKAKPKDGNN